VKIDETSVKPHSTSKKDECDKESQVTNNETARQRGEKPITNPKRNNRDADSKDTSDDSTAKATNPDKEGIRPRTVSISSEGDADSMETCYEIPKEIERIKLKTV
jgi:hypothetical protein